jgi:hypothetical protein
MSLTATCGASERVGVLVIGEWEPLRWTDVVRARVEAGFTITD